LETSHLWHIYATALLIVNRRKNPTSQGVFGRTLNLWNRFLDLFVLNLFGGAICNKDSIASASSSSIGLTVDNMCLMEPTDHDQLQMMDYKN
jgi:hypothetical protein